MASLASVPEVTIMLPAGSWGRLLWGIHINETTLTHQRGGKMPNKIYGAKFRASKCAHCLY